MLAISQKPERVSNILRSSTAITRVNGIGPGLRVALADGGPVDAWWCSCCCSFSLGVGGELEEHLLQAGAVGRPQLGEGDAGRERDLARPASGSASARSGAVAEAGR